MTEAISIVYRVPGKPPATLTFDGAKHDVWAVCAWVERKLWPDRDPGAPDLVFDRVMARIRKERK